MLNFLMEVWGRRKIEIYNAKFFDGSMGGRKIEIYNANSFYNAKIFYNAKYFYIANCFYNAKRYIMLVILVAV